MIQDKIDRLVLNIKKRIYFRILGNSSPEKLMRLGDSVLIKRFKNAAENVPAYNQILKKRKINVKNIQNIEDFKRLPILSKEDLFPKFKVTDLCIGGNLKGMVSAFTSSGFSKNNFAYGMITQRDIKNVKETISFIFEKFFNAKNKTTMLINANAMGVFFPSYYPLMNTGVRPDMILALLRGFKDNYKQFVVLCDPHFAKRIIDFGEESGFNWKSVEVSFILGGDWVPQSLIKYLKRKLSEDSKIFVSMGVAEFGLNLFHNDLFLSNIREIVQNNPELRRELFGDINVAPEIMYYYPMRTFVEVISTDENGFGNIILSNLDKHSKMPLMRYNTQDKAKIFDHNVFLKILKKHGISGKPTFNLPIISVLGRKNHCLKYKGKKISIEEVKEALYTNNEIAEKVTGYVFLNSSIIEVQLRENKEYDWKLKSKIENEIYNLTGVRMPVKVYLYKDFPHGIGLDYEHKFKCV
ncbi:MAG: hypothetical protein ABH840_04260 [Nanoarchaeota archaeon]